MSVAVGLAQALVHGGYSPDKLHHEQKAQLYKVSVFLHGMCNTRYVQGYKLYRLCTGHVQMYRHHICKEHHDHTLKVSASAAVQQLTLPPHRAALPLTAPTQVPSTTQLLFSYYPATVQLLPSWHHFVHAVWWPTASAQL